MPSQVHEVQSFIGISVTQTAVEVRTETNIASLWLHVVCSGEYSYTTVDHKFMVPRHSYLPNDRDFSSIEEAKCKTDSLPTF